MSTWLSRKSFLTRLAKTLCFTECAWMIVAVILITFLPAPRAHDTFFFFFCVEPLKTCRNLVLLQTLCLWQTTFRWFDRTFQFLGCVHSLFWYLDWIQRRWVDGQGGSTKNLTNGHWLQVESGWFFRIARIVRITFNRCLGFDRHLFASWTNRSICSCTLSVSSLPVMTSKTARIASINKSFVCAMGESLGG